MSNIAEHYLENTRGNHNKFYEVVLKRTQSRQRPFEVVCRWGRIGQTGRTSSKGTYVYEGAANNKVRAILQEKLDKGYIEIENAKSRKKAKAASTRQAKGEETYEDILLNRFSDILE
jgi:predicted DNA-binding WGR domain protein